MAQSALDKLFLANPGFKAFMQQHYLEWYADYINQQGFYDGLPHLREYFDYIKKG